MTKEAALSTLTTPAQRGRRIALTGDAQKVAEARLAVIQPLIDYVADAECRKSFAHLELADGTRITTSDLLARYLSESRTCLGKPVGRATIWAWKKLFTGYGLNGLARAVREDSGQSRFFRKYPDAAKLVAATYLKPYQTVQTAYDALYRDLHLLNCPRKDLPSYSTVRKFLETIPKPIAVLAREGEREHKERMAPYLSRGYTGIPVNAIWTTDHALHDVEVRNDVFAGIDADAPMRLRFTCFMDMRSRKIVGYTWTPEGSSHSITTALRRAIERYGPPESVYSDNGADFCKVAKGARPVADGMATEVVAIERTGVLARLGIKVQFCIPYSPQSKNIERFFRTMHLKLDALFPHYTTGNAYDKPDYTVIAMAEHRKLLRMDRGHESPLVPASHFIRMAASWIEQSYNAGHEHSGKGMDGQTPDQVFAAGYSDAWRSGFDLSVLDELLWSRERRRVRECSITLGKRRFTATDATSSTQMYLRNEQDVLVCYDPHDMDRAVVCDLDGHRLAEVAPERLMTHSASDAPDIAASMQERRRLRNASAQTVRTLRNDVAMAGHRSDLDLLHERALLPLAVGDFITQRPPQTAHAEAGELHKTLHSDDIGDDIVSRLRRTGSNGTFG